MEWAKRRVQCIHEHISYEEHIHQIVCAACSTKQLSVNASPQGSACSWPGETRPLSWWDLLPGQTRKSLKGNTGSRFIRPTAVRVHEQLHSRAGNQRSKNVSCPRVCPDSECVGLIFHINTSGKQIFFLPFRQNIIVIFRSFSSKTDKYSRITAHTMVDYLNDIHGRRYKEESHILDFFFSGFKHKTFSTTVSLTR